MRSSRPQPSYYQPTNKRRVIMVCALFLVIPLTLYLTISDQNKNSPDPLELTATTTVIHKDTIIAYCIVPLNDSTLWRQIKRANIQHPKIVFAQAKIESGNYQSSLTRQFNNLFGMNHPNKRHTTSLGKCMGPFARYKTWIDSVQDYALWQANYANNLSKDQYFEKLRGSYAEDPNYIWKIQSIIKDL